MTRNMFRGVLDLQDLDVSQIMVHRKSIDMIDADQGTAEIIEAALNTSHTRVPLYRGQTENIIGVLHARDLMAAMARAGGDTGKVDIAAITREAWFIPDTTNLKDQIGGLPEEEAALRFSRR
ncbi:MAG: hypothetical protein WDN06_19570 [Asticcacaulis sp.]